MKYGIFCIFLIMVLLAIFVSSRKENKPMYFKSYKFYLTQDQIGYEDQKKDVNRRVSCGCKLVGAVIEEFYKNDYIDVLIDESKCNKHKGGRVDTNSI